MNASLASLPPADTADWPELRVRIDERLDALLPLPRDRHDLVAAALRHGVLAPGKRIRPLLMLLVGRGLGRASEALLDLACAVEMVHAASLFLDDLPCMDDARLRRGLPTVHARYGQDVAVLGAVALLSQAWRIAACAEGLSPATRNQLVVLLSDAVGLQGLVRGQYRDLREGAAARPAEDIASANHQKTGALFAAALDMAALACGARDGIRLALREAATELGHAFQLRDDLEDGDESSVPTKDRHQDTGKSTLVSLLGRDAVRQRLHAHLDHAEDLLRTALPHDGGATALVRHAFGRLPRAPQSAPDFTGRIGVPRRLHGGAHLRVS